ncbi:MAG TPA: DUF1801 domain-containing protein [Cyclobacteriaceae bacterium]|nr:DUF1801 domain-containing protein [Cyclobacteriaceae bacterium]
MEALPKFKTVDEYIDFYSGDVKSRLESLRKTIKKAAPKADEIIAYNMPGYRQDGVVIYFSAFKKHISIFPRPAEFKKELEKYEGGKGTVQIPHTEPLPLRLVAEMVKFRVIKNKKESGKK